MNYNDINKLKVAELNKAVALADGWALDLNTIYQDSDIYGNPIELTDGWKHEKLGIIRRYLENYRSGDLIDRLAREAEIIPYRSCEGGYSICVVPNGNPKFFQSESLTTAILRAWLWYMQEVKL